MNIKENDSNVILALYPFRLVVTIAFPCLWWSQHWTRISCPLLLDKINSPSVEPFNASMLNEKKLNIQTPFLLVQSGNSVPHNSVVYTSIRSMPLTELSCYPRRTIHDVVEYKRASPSHTPFANFRYCV